MRYQRRRLARALSLPHLQPGLTLKRREFIALVGGGQGEAAVAMDLVSRPNKRPRRGRKGSPFGRTGGSNHSGGWTGNGNARRIYENVHLIRALPAPALAVQREVNDEARSDRYRKRGYFGWRPRMHGPIAATALLEPIPRLPIPPNPRLGSPRGRSAHYSVCRPEQSGSHRRG